MFVHLNCHSHYSLLAGADGIDALVQAAVAHGLPALALTDTNGLYGAVAFYQAARAAGLHPVFGVELVGENTSCLSLEKGGRIASGGNENLKPPADASPFRKGGIPNLRFAGRAILLARNRKGFSAICRAITARHLDPDFTLADCLAGLGPEVLVLCPDAALLECVAKVRGTHNLFAELTRPAPLRDERHLIDTALRFGIPLTASNRVFFIQPVDWAVHRLLSAIRTNTTVQTLPPDAVVSPECWFKSPQEMARLFADQPEALRVTRDIAEQCQVAFELGHINPPPFPLPPGETHASLLRRLAEDGLHRLYGDDPRAARRMEEELAVIDALSFHSYFLIVWDIVREAQARGIPTVGRGSAANSLVCRVLGITQVDPIRYNLYFERFLNLERSDYPDIDLDFPWNRRDEMLDYVFDKYGNDHVALISTHVHFRSRSLVREVGKALGVPIAEIDRFTRPLPHFGDLSEIHNVRATVPECRDLPIDDEPYRSILQQARRIDGFPRHLSIHCGGIVISPHPITDDIPLETTPKGFAITQYDMYPVEDMGLLKIDLLAQKGLAVLSDTIADVRAHYGIALDFDRLDPVADPATRALVAEGRTIGCFYIESPGMRNLLQKLNVQSFEMLTAASSIIRPGVSDSGMMKAFIDRHNGREAVSYLHPKLEAVLADTFGVMIYQEDVIKVAHAVAGMSLGEAEGLRKCMSKKRDWERMETYRERFLTGARDNGVAAGTAREIWRQIESFAGYAFCKAHSASFALVSYQTAYLKAHYPAEFMAAVLSNRGGFYDSCAYVEEARRLGLTILPPDVNASEDRYCATGRTIRIGLSQVKGLSQETINLLLTERPFVSLTDCLSRARPEQPEAESLVRAGAFDSLTQGDRAALMWELLLWFKARRVERAAMAALSGQAGLFEPAGPSWRPVTSLPEISRSERLLAELECLDLTVSEHLLGLYRPEDRLPRSGGGLVEAQHLTRHAGRLVTLAGWLVTAKRTRTARLEMMKFMTLEDATGVFEVTLFPRVYRQFGHLLHDRGPYLVRGRVEKEGACCTLTALWVGRADAPKR